MRPTTKTVTGAGTSDWIPMDVFQNPFNVGLAVKVAGTVNYTVQYTLDDLQDSSVTPLAFDHPDMVSLTTSSAGNFAFPVTGIRLNIGSGFGSGTLIVIQVGVYC